MKVKVNKRNLRIAVFTAMGGVTDGRIHNQFYQNVPDEIILEAEPVLEVKFITNGMCEHEHKADCCLTCTKPVQELTDCCNAKIIPCECPAQRTDYRICSKCNRHYGKLIATVEEPKKIKINPLKGKQYSLLVEMGCRDAADKIEEIVRHINKT